MSYWIGCCSYCLIFEDEILKKRWEKDKRLLNKLYKWEYQELERQHANDPYWISPGIYTEKNLRKAILDRKKAFGIK